jgi:hypothetical protein
LELSRAHQAAAEAVLTLFLKGSVAEVQLLESGGYELRSGIPPSSELIVTMAGPLAAELQCAETEGRPPSYASVRKEIILALEYETQEDWSRATNGEAPAELATPIWRISRFLCEDVTDLDARLSTLFSQADNLVRACWTQIGWVAAALLEHQRLSGAQVEQIAGAAGERS